jgi:hypothetical protein
MQDGANDDTFVNRTNNPIARNHFISFTSDLNERTIRMDQFEKAAQCIVVGDERQEGVNRIDFHFRVGL